MATYIFRRLIQAVVVILLVSVLVFILVRQLPGDPVLMYMTQQQYKNVTPEELALVKHDLGLDRSMAVQYFDWLYHVFQGDLGRSLLQRQQVTDYLKSALPMSLYLGGIAFIISNILAIPMGVACAVRRGRKLDTVLTFLANIGITAPTFWVGVMLIYLFTVWQGWLPSHGFTWPTQDLAQSFKQIIMPVVCLAMFPIAATVRQTRSAMLEIIAQDYIRTARAKGLSETVVIMKHMLRNGLIPVVTLAGLNVGMIFGGQVLVETVFSVPGMGMVAVSALLERDYAIVQGVVLVVSTAVVLVNLLVDLSYAWLDPRIRYS